MVSKATKNTGASAPCSEDEALLRSLAEVERRLKDLAMSRDEALQCLNQEADKYELLLKRAAAVDAEQPSHAGTSFLLGRPSNTGRGVTDEDLQRGSRSVGGKGDESFGSSVSSSVYSAPLSQLNSSLKLTAAQEKRLAELRCTLQGSLERYNKPLATPVSLGAAPIGEPLAASTTKPTPAKQQTRSRFVTRLENQSFEPYDRPNSSDVGVQVATSQPQVRFLPVMPPPTRPHRVLSDPGLVTDEDHARVMERLARLKCSMGDEENAYPRFLPELKSTNHVSTSTPDLGPAAQTSNQQPGPPPHSRSSTDLGRPTSARCLPSYRFPPASAPARKGLEPKHGSLRGRMPFVTGKFQGTQSHSMTASIQLLESRLTQRNAHLAKALRTACLNGKDTRSLPADLSRTLGNIVDNIGKQITDLSLRYKETQLEIDNLAESGDQRDDLIRSRRSIMRLLDSKTTILERTKKTLALVNSLPTKSVHSRECTPCLDPFAEHAYEQPTMASIQRIRPPSSQSLKTYSPTTKFDLRLIQELNAALE